MTPHAPPPQSHLAYWQAYWHVRNRILSGEFKGGDRVNPAEVGEALGISRMPVREALRQLDAEGLVTIRPNRGATVTTLTPAEVSELFEIRAVLEALAARLALPHLVGEAFEELDILRQRMDRARGDAKLWVQRHNDFHDFIAAQSRRPRLNADIGRIRDAIQPYLLLYIDVYHSTEMPGFEHTTVMDAIRSRNSQLLELTIRDHVMSAASGVIEFLQNRQREQEPRASLATGRRAAASSPEARP